MLTELFELLLQHKWSRDIKLAEQVIYCDEYRIIQESEDKVLLHFNTSCNPLLAVKLFGFLEDMCNEGIVVPFEVGASYYIDELNQVTFISSITDKELLA